MYRVAYGVVRQREDALDIVQEVFIKLFRSIKKFKGKSHFYTYLYRMAMNTAIDHTPKDEEDSLLQPLMRMRGSSYPMMPKKDRTASLPIRNWKKG